MLPILLVAALALSACSRREASIFRGDPPEITEVRHYPALVAGRMESSYLSILAEENPLEECDHEHKQEILWVMRAIDEHSEARSTLSGPLSRLPELDAPGLDIGPGHFAFDGRESMSADVEEEWRSGTSASLPRVLEHHRPLLRSGLMTEDDWRFLERYFVSRMADDGNRLRARVNYRQHPGNQHVMDELWAAFRVCASNACQAHNILERLSLEAELLISEVPSYAYLAEQIRTFSHDETEVASLGASLFKWLNRDIKMHRPKDSIKRVSASTYKLTLDPGVFSVERPLMAGVIERVWRSNDRRVVVDWEQRNPLDVIVKYLLIWKPERGRAHVNHDAREARFFVGTNVIDVSHEIGHVMGFPDYYYTMWNAQACAYTHISSTRDLMSAGGLVGPRHWEALEKAYPDTSR